MNDATNTNSIPASDVEVTEIQKPRRPRGFAAMDPKRVAEIASKGGKAAHAAGTAHQFNREEAIAAGRKGGIAPHIRRGRGPANPNGKLTFANVEEQVPDTVPTSKVA